MATTKRTKANLEFLLVKAELKGIPEKGVAAEPQHRTGGNGRGQTPGVTTVVNVK